MKRALVWAVVAALGCAPVFARQPEAVEETFPSDSLTRVGTLPNGLTYYIRHNDFQPERADFYLAQRVGSILERPEQRGLAHFLEHMAFNGSRHFPDKELIHYLERIGVQFGGNLNAYTGVDETVYLIKDVPLTRPAVLDSCLLALRDWSDGILLDDDEIDKERGVIEEEWRSRDNCLMRQYAVALPVLYAGGKYADCLPIGDIEVIRHFPYEDLRAYYKRWYRPDLQAVIVVGDIDPDDTEKKIRERFRDASVPDGAPERVYYPVPDPPKRRVALTRDKEAPFALVSLNWLQPDRPRGYGRTLDGMKESYLRDMMSRMLQARLEEILQAPDPPFVQANAGFGPFMVSQARYSWSVEAIASDGQCAAACRSLLTEWERARRHGFTMAEYGRAKAEARASLEHAFAERRNQPNRYYVDQCLDHFTDGAAMPGAEEELRIFDQVLSSIPLEEVNTFAAKADSLPVLCWISGPEGGNLPGEEELNAWMDSVRAADITPYEEVAPAASLLTDLPAPGKVEKERPGKFGTTEFTLSNGVRVVLKPTLFKEDEVRFKAYSPGGYSLENTRRDAVTLSLTDDLAELGGLGALSDVDLRKSLAGKRVESTMEVSPFSETVTASSSAHDLETMFQLVYLQFTALRRDEGAFRAYSDRLSAALVNQDKFPMTEYADSLAAVVYGGHPLRLRLRSGDVALLDYDKGLEILRRRFADAADFTFYIAGSVTADTLRPLLERYLAALPAGDVRERPGDADFMETPGRRACRYSKVMENPKTTVTIRRSGSLKYTLKNMLALSMLEQVMDIVYTETVREEEGGTYGVSTRGIAAPLPEGRYEFQIRFTTDSAKLDRLLPVVYGELERVAEEGPRPDDVRKVREYMTKAYRNRQIDNGYWLDVLVEKDASGVDRQSSYLKTLRSLSASDVKAMARRVLDSPNAKEVIQVGVSAR